MVALERLGRDPHRAACTIPSCLSGDRYQGFSESGGAYAGECRSVNHHLVDDPNLPLERFGLAVTRHRDLAAADGNRSQSGDRYCPWLDGMRDQHEPGSVGWFSVDASRGCRGPRNRFDVADGFAGIATHRIGVCRRRKVGFHPRGTRRDRSGTNACRKKPRVKVIRLARH